VKERDDRTTGLSAWGENLVEARRPRLGTRNWPFSSRLAVPLAALLIGAAGAGGIAIAASSSDEFDGELSGTVPADAPLPTLAGYDCPAYQAWGRAVYNPRWNELMEQGVKLTGENADELLPHPPKNICAPSE